MHQHIERATRRRTYKQAFIRSSETGGNKSCILKNISDSGALLQFDDANGLPMHFTVKVELDAFEVPAKWIRREGERIGVKFTGSTKHIKPGRAQVLKSPDDPQLRRTAVESEFKKQLFELRNRQTLESLENSDSASNPASPLKKRPTGFGKR